MLTALRLGNFKAFAGIQRMPIKPLTLIFGPNSAGKSSLIHSLILAHHAMNAESDDENRIDVHRTQIGGESVDLGGFHQYVYHRDALNHVTWSVDLDVAQMKGRLAEMLAPVRSVNVSLQIGLKHIEKTKPQRIINPHTNKPETIQVPSGELAPQGTPHVKSFELNADGRAILRCTHRPEGYLQLDQLEHHHPVFKNLVRDLLLSQTTTENITTEDQKTADQAITDLVPTIGLQPGSFLPSGLLRFEGQRGLDPMAMFQYISQEHRQEQIANAIRLFLPFNLNELISNLDGTLREEFKRLQYLGPLRSYPPRHLAFAQYYDPNWYAGGGYAWDVVLRDEKVRTSVNAWLGSAERLLTPYELQIRKLVPDVVLSRELSSRVERVLHDFLTKLLQANAETVGTEEYESLDVLVEELRMDRWEQEEGTEAFSDYLKEMATSLIDPNVVAETWTKDITDLMPDDNRELVLVDKRTGTPVSHRDVGIGVSQVLPVLVSAYGSRQKLIAIEQPEIHLHPRLQAELGDVFIEAALGERRNTFLIETHSEHLMLRIMRRMRDTVNDKLPKGLPPVRPEDIAVLYVQPHGASSVVRVLELDEEGQLLDPFPGGFFEEGFHERFA